MVDWDATEYRRVGDLQRWLAARAPSGLDLHGVEPCWTCGGCGGRITAGIATAPDRGEVEGIDPSPRSGQLAASTDAPNGGVPLRFEVGDVLGMPFESEFDLVVSFDGLQRNHLQQRRNVLLAGRLLRRPTPATRRTTAPPASARAGRPDRFHLLGSASPHTEAQRRGIYSTTNTTFLGLVDDGTWRWQVTYTGDANNRGSSLACGVERFTILNH